MQNWHVHNSLNYIFICIAINLFMCVCVALRVLVCVCECVSLCATRAMNKPFAKRKAQIQENNAHWHLLLWLLCKMMGCLLSASTNVFAKRKSFGGKVRFFPLLLLLSDLITIKNC